MIISKKQLIGVVAIGILLAGVVFFIWWVSKGRFIQTTDDAYIGGNITTVASKVSGYISAIEVRDNQSVKKGDIILRLDDRDYRANVARLEAKIKSSKANLESIQATIAMQQSIIQSASETWQAVKHEEQKRLRDTERYEKLAQSAAISHHLQRQQSGWSGSSRAGNRQAAVCCRPDAALRPGLRAVPRLNPPASGTG